MRRTAAALVFCEVVVMEELLSEAVAGETKVRVPSEPKLEASDMPSAMRLPPWEANLSAKGVEDGGWMAEPGLLRTVTFGASMRRP
jgi:hypothetical protein